MPNQTEINSSSFNLTKDQLKKIMPGIPDAKFDLYFPLLTKAMSEFEINNACRASAFLAQLAHESGQLRYMEEIHDGSNYEGRKDLGNTEPGDGKRYKGRGPIQLTGRINYRLFGKELGLDLEDEPLLAAKPEVGFRIAGCYWRRKGLNPLADACEFKEITRKINGGYNGLDDRIKYYNRAKEVLGVK